MGTSLLGWVLIYSGVGIPIFVAFSKDAIIPGYLIVNDSVNHASLLRGFIYTRNRALSEDMAWVIEHYPRAAHSFLFYINKVIKTEPARLLLPGILFFQSLIAFAYEPLLCEGRKGKFGWKLLILLCISLTFLSCISAYLIFLAQVFCAPLVLAGVVFIFRDRKEGIKEWELPVVIILGSACIVSYSIFPLSILIFAFLIEFTVSWFHGSISVSSVHGYLVRLVRTITKRNATIMVAFLAVLVTIYPQAIYIWQVFYGQLTPTNHESLLSAYGNLPRQLSPSHLSGVWINNVDYRDNIGGSRVEPVFVGILFVQLFFIFRRKQFDGVSKTAFCITVLPFLAWFSMPGPYIPFKYLAYATPAFMGAVAIGCIEFFENRGYLGTILPVFLLTGVIYGEVINPRGSFQPNSVITEKYWRDLEKLKQDWIDKGNTLILSKEDWVQDFISDPGDFAPLTLYMHRDWDGRQMDFVIIDRTEPEVVKGFLDSHPSLSKDIEATPAQCKRDLTERFRVYNLQCEREELRKQNG